MWGAGRAKPSLLTPPRRRQRRIAGAAKHEMHVRGQLVDGLPFIRVASKMLATCRFGIINV
jgi:hypothetical protein